MAYHGKYKSPADLLRDETLSFDDKVEMLEDWRDDKEAFIRASDEGMEGDDRSDVLAEIEKALITLREGPSPR